MEDFRGLPLKLVSFSRMLHWLKLNYVDCLSEKAAKTVENLPACREKNQELLFFPQKSYINICKGTGPLKNPIIISAFIRQ